MLGNYCYFCNELVDFQDAANGEMDYHESCIKDASDDRSDWERGFHQGIHLYDGFEPSESFIEHWFYPLFIAVIIICLFLAIAK